MRLKQMIAVGLSAAMMLAVTPGVAVFANTKQANTVATKLMSDNARKSGGGQSSESENLVHSETISDSDSGSEITWSFFDSGKLVIEGTGATPNWSPWFNYKEQITDVIVGDGITTLGERNFSNYSELKTVTIEGALSKISASAFEKCGKLKSIAATGAVNATGKRLIQLGKCAFKECTGLESVEVTGRLATGENAFAGCTSLRSIKVKEADMALLGAYTFLNCAKLTEVDIPGRLLIQEGAFGECTSLKNFDFSNVSSIGKLAFYNCSSLESIDIPKTQFITGISESAFYSCSSLKSIVLPENITAVGNNAFYGCDGVTSLRIPGTVQSIGENAFSSCKNLKELVIDEGVSNIGKNAFAACESLETVTIPKSATIGENIFTDYKPIKTIRYTGTREEWVAAGLNQNNFFNATVYYEYTANHEHTFVTYTYTYTNSCTELGERVTKCKTCGYVQSEETLPAQGHTWQVVSEKKATCKAEGLQNLKCKRCGETKKVVLAKTHTFSSWKKTEAATVFAPAIQTRICSVCGRKETRNNGKKLTATIKVNATKLPLKIKQKTTVLKVSGLANGDSVASWKSSNTKVVKVSGKSNGTCTLIAGSKKGKATITITLKSGLKKKVTITVQTSAVKTSKITGIAKNLKLKKNQTFALKTTVTPLTSLQKVQYKSSNTKVVTVTSKGVVKAKKKGTAIITVKSGNKTVKCKVTVK